MAFKMKAASRFPMAQLDVGDSFFIGDGDADKARTLCENANRLLAPRNFAFKAYAMGEDPKHPTMKGVRVWRAL